MDIVVKGYVQALKDGRHNSPYAEGGAQEPAEYTGGLRLWIPSGGKKAHFTFEIDATNRQDVILNVRGSERKNKATLYKVLPKRKSWSKEEEALYGLFQAVLRPMFEQAQKANERGNTYRVTTFETIWKIDDKKLTDIIELISDEKVSVQ